jgi:hypothetical protein
MKNCSRGLSCWFLHGGLLCLAACACRVPLAAQSLMAGSGPGGQVRILNTDAAVLELGEKRTDLPCTVVPVKPVLGFDLKFHAGYEVSVPLREIAGPENLLTIIFRVTYEDRKDAPVMFSQRIGVPVVQEESRGEAYLQGNFDLGEGVYHIDWIMRDRAERVCSDYWDTEAVLPPKEKSIQVALAPGEVRSSDVEPFKEEPPVSRTQDAPPLTVKVLINFAPQNSRSATLQPLDTAALISILRSISREPRIGKFSVIAFNLQEQRLVCRQDSAERIDFPALGKALESLKLGTVDLRRLSEKHGDTQFLTDLLKREIGETTQPDALIFAGPKALLDENVPEEALKGLGGLNYPVFYMNYNLDPRRTPWRDSIGHAVRFLKGYEYTISRPKDLWFAMTEMVSRIVKSKQERSATAIAPTQ